MLAAVLGAVDLGYRVVLATDALCSSADQTHDALLTFYRQRFAQQIETAEAETILAELAYLAKVHSVVAGRGFTSSLSNAFYCQSNPKLANE